jgi:uncharacterized protein (TIGR04255 family)
LIKKHYPLIEDHPVLAPLADQPQGGFIFDLPPLRRVFFIENQRNQLIQLQSNRFLNNWRKVNDTDEYPRFVNIQKRFQENWGTFKQFTVENQIGTPEPDQYELTYINHIIDSPGTFPLGIEKYLPIVGIDRSRSDHFLPDPKVFNLSLRYDLPDQNGTLHFSLKHGSRKADKNDVVILEVTARGPAESNASNLEQWLSLSHEWIVRGFTELSSPVAHELWGRTR